MTQPIQQPPMPIRVTFRISSDLPSEPVTLVMARTRPHPAIQPRTTRPRPAIAVEMQT
jgi:hypothetical protein